MTEPNPPDPHWSRYSARLFPLYRFVPGQTPHPRRHPGGHSYIQPEPQPELFPADQWQDSEDYLYGIDRYNFAYWWECHEVFESLWHSAGHETEQGRLFQALIQLAATNLKQFMGDERAAHNLLRSCARRLAGLPDFYMGVPVTRLSQDIQRSLATNQPCNLLLKLG